MTLKRLNEWLEELNHELEEADTDAYRAQIREAVEMVLSKTEKFTKDVIAVKLDKSVKYVNSCGVRAYLMRITLERVLYSYPDEATVSSCSHEEFLKKHREVK